MLSVSSRFLPRAGSSDGERFPEAPSGCGELRIPLWMTRCDLDSGCGLPMGCGASPSPGGMPQLPWFGTGFPTHWEDSGTQSAATAPGRPSKGWFSDDAPEGFACLAEGSWDPEGSPNVRWPSFPPVSPSLWITPKTVEDPTIEVGNPLPSSLSHWRYRSRVPAHD